MLRVEARKLPVYPRWFWYRPHFWKTQTEEQISLGLSTFFGKATVMTVSRSWKSERKGWWPMEGDPGGGPYHGWQGLDARLPWHRELWAQWKYSVEDGEVCLSRVGGTTEESSVPSHLHKPGKATTTSFPRYYWSRHLYRKQVPKQVKSYLQKCSFPLCLNPSISIRTHSNSARTHSSPNNGQVDPLSQEWEIREKLLEYWEYSVDQEKRIIQRYNHNEMGNIKKEREWTILSFVSTTNCLAIIWLIWKSVRNYCF